MAEKTTAYGIWCGKDATVAVVEDFSIAFLRIRKDRIASVLKHWIYGTVGVVYGLGINSNASAVYCAKSPESGIKFCNRKEGADKLEQHSGDTFCVVENDRLIYTMYDGTVFELELAEKIDMAVFERTYPADPSLPVAKRMALWETGMYFEYRDGYFNVGVDTERYSIYYNFSVADKYVYCRVGQNGYCEKGRAMLSTTCIRQNECRMIADNLQTLKEYRPVEECFVSDGCAFPSDGGWYWSIKSVTDDVIYLNGCGGVTYEIRRK